MIYIREAHPKDGWWLGKGLPGMLLKLDRSTLYELSSPQVLYLWTAY